MRRGAPYITRSILPTATIRRQPCAPSRKNLSIPSRKLSPCSGGIFDWDSAQERSPNYNKRSEDPNLWTDRKAAQKLMRQRQLLERSINSYKQLERGLDDSVTLIELGESEGDQASIAEGESQLRKLDEEAQRRSVEALLSGEADSQRHLRRGPRRSRRHRKPGLGLHARAHVHALGGGARLQGGGDRGERGRRSRHQIGDLRDQGRKRLRLAQDRSRACTGWCASRRTMPTRAATRALRPCGSFPWSTTTSTSTSRRASAASTPIARAAPAVSTSTRPTQPCASRTCRPASRSQPAGALADQEPRHRLGDAEIAPL